MASILKIIYWSDFACPFCYIGEKRLENAIKELFLKDFTSIKMKAFELNPYASKKVESITDERFANKYGLSLSAARARIDSISQLGRAEGIDFKYADTLYTNTFDAHRLTKFAEKKGKDERKLIHLLYDAYFTKNLKLAERSVLIDIAKKVGLNEQEVNEMLNGEHFANEVKQDEMESLKMGIHGVPYFVINDKYVINGAQSKENIKEIINEALNEQLEKKGSGMVCGVDGCNVK